MLRLFHALWLVEKMISQQAPAVEHILAILVSLFWNETCKNVLARLKRDETIEIRRSDGQTKIDRQCLLANDNAWKWA